MSERFKLTWSIKEDDSGLLIKDFLKAEELSKTALTDIKFKGGQILVNNQEVNVRYKLQQGDKLTLFFPVEEVSDGMKAEDIPLEILYEDDWILVVNKPAGMSSIPSREHPNGSLANALIGYYEGKQIFATAHIVTRLDRDTSGIVLVAKHRHVHHLFSKQQRSGSVRRTYEAFVEGIFQLKTGTIEEPIGRKDDSIIEREVRSDGQYACTHYLVLGEFPNFTHLQLKLETGRTHQIRVHLAHLGHPLVGDDLYGGSLKLLSRQALHCRSIAFFHPVLKEAMKFEATVAKDMEKLLLQN